MAIDTNPNTKNFITEDRYPLPQLKSETFYVNDTMTSVSPSSETKFSFSMDPLSDNGDICTSKNLSRSRIASFTSVFDKQENMLGDIDVNAYVSIDSPQSDLFAIVRKWNTDGSVVCLGKRGARITRKGKPTLVQFSVGPVISNFSPGEKLEVVLTNNIFPLNVRNTNSDNASNYFDRILPSRVTVWSSSEWPSNVRVTYLAKAPHSDVAQGH